MSGNFTSLWGMAFSWLGSLVTMSLPIYFGGVALSILDIVIGTAFIAASFGFIRALLKSGFSIAGKDLIAESKKQVRSSEYQNNGKGDK